MENYVLGFAFSNDLKSVVLIEKQRPEWQSGHFNGVGGKVEEGEEPKDAMVREFYEEAGIKTSWELFAILWNNTFNMAVYKCILSNNILEVESKTDEEIYICRTNKLPSNVIPNLRWLIPLAADYDGKEVVNIEYKN